MLKVGITGGIGSGKSTVCQVFETLGIPVFYADAAANFITSNDPGVISKITDLLGEDVYAGGKLDRKKVADIIFKDSSLLQQMNDIIHPATIAFGKQWMEVQTTPYAIKEAAIFFESGSNKDMDIMIGVYAPGEVRIQRIIERDNIERTKVLERIAKQMNEEEKMKLCDYIITNDGNTAVIPQVLDLHKALLERATSSL
jgi:dephospho-CoA kinase